MKMVEIECSYCHKNFKRDIYKYNRSLRWGKRSYCSQSCSTSQKNIEKNLLKEKIKPPEKLPSGIPIDEFSPFRKYMLSVRRRANAKRGRKVYDITLQDLKKQWEFQQGICPYTGWILHLPIRVGKWDQNKDHLLRASIDRLDSSRGYIKGNIQFISNMANLAKNNLSSIDLIIFCRAVSAHNKSLPENPA